MQERSKPTFIDVIGDADFYQRTAKILRPFITHFQVSIAKATL